MADEGRDIQDQTASEAKNDAPCVQIDTTLSQVTHEDAKQQGRASIQPVAWPTSQQISTAKTKTQYTEGAFHIATAGSSGSGKSSLINAFRGLSNRDNRAAPTGFVETTRVIGRYEDPDPKRPLVWYDMPSIGTLEVPDSQHFNDEGLFVFDCVVVLFDHRLTEQDVALLRYCAHFQIPSYIVRSKSDAQIGAIEREMRVANADDEGEEEDGLEAVHVSRIGEYEEARGRYMRETNESVHRTLAQAGLPVQTVYFVARDTLRKVIKESLRKHSGNPLQNILRTNSDTPANVGKPSRDNRLEEKVLHERHLLEDMIQTGYGRRQKK